MGRRDDEILGDDGSAAVVAVVVVVVDQLDLDGPGQRAVRRTCAVQDLEHRRDRCETSDGSATRKSKIRIRRKAFQNVQQLL